MARFSLSSHCRRDLAEIWEYIAQHSVHHANELHERFYSIFSLLCRQPEIGVDASEVMQGTRKFPVDNYVVYYRITQRGVRILHVFHSRRSVRKALRKQ